MTIKSYVCVKHIYQTQHTCKCSGSEEAEWFVKYCVVQANIITLNPSMREKRQEVKVDKEK